MIEIENITKKYITGDTVVDALKGVSLRFRKSEFVSILGPSGCGKTTLLNILGGLDRYTSGDLKIDEKSTKMYNDGDWDTYRNHYVGFIFQSYNLIGHLTVIENVELALSIAGYNKAEKREKAIKALEKVGLSGQINKRPNQLSGGQMQRVAIARAIVNEPKIILADEPTGALDTETSVQVMDILKELSKDRLVIMVTHNERLADLYSSRIIKILDGVIIDDSMPIKQDEVLEKFDEIAKDEYIEQENVLQEQNGQKQIDAKKAKGRKSKLKKHSSMGFWTAFKLSLRNLGTKKTRTILTSFAGSIGIIGIALVLALSNGFQAYVDKTERDTMSTYPITIQQTSINLTSVLENLYQNTGKTEYPDADNIYVNNVLEDFMRNYATKAHTNDLKKFKKYLEENLDKSKVNGIQCVYDINMNIYKSDYTDTKNTQINPFEIPASITASMPMMTMLSNQMDVWTEMLDNQSMLEGQYELLGNSKWPTNYDEVVLVVDKYNQINDFMLYALGMRDYSEIEAIMNSIATNTPLPEQTSPNSYSYDDILATRFKIVVQGDYYQKNGDIFENKSQDAGYMKTVLDNSTTLKVVGILRPKQGVNISSVNGAIGYTKDLTEYLVNKNNQTQVVTAQKQNPNLNVFTNAEFASDESLQSNLSILDVADIDSPKSIYIYPAEFEAKDYISDFIKDYNSKQPSKESTIEYTDFIGVMLSSVTTIINAITYILVAFVSISLVVSSIMIGIITYISVLERTKEIGILRSVGARKKDVKRVFNAETLIIGFISGAFGIFVTYILTIPANLILVSLIQIPHIASLNILHAILLVAISMTLTLISGLIPASIASKKDPVTALRSE